MQQVPAWLLQTALQKVKCMVELRHERRGQSWCAIAREPERADEEVVKPKRPCKANTSDVVGIDACSKTCMAAQKISQVVSP